MLSDNLNGCDNKNRKWNVSKIKDSETHNFKYKIIQIN